MIYRKNLETGEVTSFNNLNEIGTSFYSSLYVESDEQEYNNSNCGYYIWDGIYWTVCLEKYINKKINELKDKRQSIFDNDIEYIHNEEVYYIKATEKTEREISVRENKIENQSSEELQGNDRIWYSDYKEIDGLKTICVEKIIFEEKEDIMDFISYISNYFQQNQQNYLNIKSEIYKCTTCEEVDLVDIDTGW